MGADEDLIIKLKLENAEALAKTAAVGASFDRTTAKAEAAAKKIGAAHQSAAQGQFVSLERVQVAAVKYGNKMEANAKKVADAQIASAKKVADAQIAEAARSAAAQEKAAKSAGGGITGALQGVSAAAIALKIATGAFEYFANKFEGMRNSIIGSVKELEVMRGQVLNLAMLNDRLGNTTTETRATLEFRGQTLQSRDEAVQFQEGIKNTGQASIGRKISQEQFDALSVKGGQFQAAVGGGAETHGEFLGALPSLMKTTNGQLLTANEVFAKQQQVFDILNKGGSSLQVGSSALLKNSSLTSGGLYRDIAQQAALQSAFSLKAKDSAGTRVDQFTKATVGGLGKMRGSGIEGDDKQAEYLKSLGANDQMDPLQIGKIVSADMARQEQAEQAQGRIFNPYAYLGHRGYASDQESKMALMDFHAINQSGELGMFEGMAGATPDATRADADIKKFQNTSPTAAAMRNQVGSDLASASAGAGAPEFYQKIKALAYDRLRAQGKVYDTVGGGSAGLQKWEEGHAGWLDGSRGMIIEEARKMMEEQADKVGVKIPSQIYEGTFTGPRAVSDLSFDVNESEAARSQKFYEQAQRIGGAGGNPNGGLDLLIELAKKQLAATERAEKTMRDGQRPPTPILTGGGANAGRVR